MLFQFIFSALTLFRDSGRRARLLREEDEVAEELTERIGFTMKETKKEDEYHAKVKQHRKTTNQKKDNHTNTKIQRQKDKRRPKKRMSIMQK